MADWSWNWNHLTEEQRVRWRRLAELVRSRLRLGESHRLEGRLLFIKLNRVLATCERRPLFDPPSLPQFGRNPVTGFEIREAKGKTVFKLKVSGAARREARPPLEDLMVYSWAPYNAGVEKNRNWAFLGLVQAAKGGEINITDLYLKKLMEWRRLRQKRYHVPLEGAKVFIRVWQQVNGFENKVGKFVGSAFVPARGGWRPEDGGWRERREAEKSA
jgi:hypothetical protein